MKRILKCRWRAASLWRIPAGLAVLLVWQTTAFAQKVSDAALQQIRFDQKLNSQVSPDLAFLDESGREVQIGQYFNHGPMVLVLGYYRCPMLCSLVLNGMLECAADMRWSIGREYQIINASIDPRESSTVAAGKKRAYLKRYGRPGAEQGWHFLTGSQQSIDRLTQQVGFRYVYDPVSKEYAHPSGLIILTPEGKLSSYLFGVTFASKDLYAALQRASVNQVSSPIQQFILLCFHYNPITGKYSMTILSVLRLLGLLTVLAMAGYIVAAARRTRTAAPTAPEPNLSPSELSHAPVQPPAAPNPVSPV